MIFHSHYDEHTYQKLGETPTAKDQNDRQIALKQFRVRCVGETWVPGYGMTAMWNGPDLSKDEQNLLNLKEIVG